jgi:hypothetical protein
LFVTVGCARHAHASAAAPSPTPQSVAHVEVQGVIHLVRDLGVKQCYIGKPGTHLLNGYSVTLEGDGVIEGGEVLIPEFTGDGTYVEDAPKRASSSRALGSVMLNVARGPGFPHGTTLEEGPDSRVVVSVSGAGKNGVARFENYRTLYGPNGDEHGGVVSGSLKWMCEQVERPSM